MVNTLSVRTIEDLLVGQLDVDAAEAQQILANIGISPSIDAYHPSRAVCDSDAAVALVSSTDVVFVARTASGTLSRVCWRGDQVQAIHPESRSIFLNDRWYQLVDIAGTDLLNLFGAHLRYPNEHHPGQL